MDLQKVTDVIGAGYIFLAYIGFVIFLICAAFRGLGSVLFWLKNRFPSWWSSSGNPNDQHREDFATAFLIGGIIAVLLKTALDSYH
jgi:hypothetical protein